MDVPPQGIYLTVRTAVRYHPSWNLSNSMLLIGRPSIPRVYQYVPKCKLKKKLSFRQRVLLGSTISSCSLSWGGEMLNELRETAYNHSRTATNVGVLFTKIIVPID